MLQPIHQSVVRWLGAAALVAALIFAGGQTVQAAPAAQQATATPTLAATATLAAPAGFIAVVVKSGETLVTFVNRYKVSAQAIIAANPALQSDPNLLYVGQVLLIPTSAAPAAATAVPVIGTSPTPTLVAPGGYIAVKVQNGETLVTFVNRYKVSAQAIIAANPALQKDPNLLQVGQVLLIPVSVPTTAATALPTTVAATAAPSSGGFIEVVVQPGDTLLTYVNRYGVSAAAIITANPSIQRDPNLLQIGQRLRIPQVAPAATRGAATAVPAATSVAAKTATPSVSVSLPVPPPVANAQQITLRAGESLLTISQRYGVSAGALLKVNPQLGDSSSLVYPGQKINVPVARSTTPSRTTPFYYTLVSGDTLNFLGERFEMSALTIAAANPGTTFNVGTEILIPAGPHLVIVKAGDELRFIAARYGVTADFLLTGNSLPNPDKIYPGQLIFIPIQYDKAPLAFN
ncbi:MAG: LysM peptidoglycan-binding domain-containing protein [Anaerolineales bacterium]|nr:LysM peptidoglycan-binding domain-containing protein [Anaerolineales bacterium]